MINFLNFLISVLYRYYKKGATKTIPLFSSISVLAVLLFMNVLMLSHIIGFNLFKLIPNQEPRGIGRLALGGVIMLPFYLILYWVLDKEFIKNCRYNQSTYKWWLRGIFVYYGVSIVLLALVLKWI